MFKLTQQRRQFNCLQRADSYFPTPLRAEALYPRILVGLKERFKACVANAFGKIFQFHIAPKEENDESVYLLAGSLGNTMDSETDIASTSGHATTFRRAGKFK